MTGLSEARLKEQVTRFYQKVRADAELGPIFEDVITDWDHHIDRLTDFWSSLMLSSGRYKGNPFGAHLVFASRLEPALFDRWLALWSQTATELFDPQTAETLEDRASRIAQSMMVGLFGIGHPRTTSPRGVRPSAGARKPQTGAGARTGNA